MYTGIVRVYRYGTCSTGTYCSNRLLLVPVYRKCNCMHSEEVPVHTVRVLWLTDRRALTVYVYIQHVLIYRYVLPVLSTEYKYGTSTVQLYKYLRTLTSRGGFQFCFPRRIIPNTVQQYCTESVLSLYCTLSWLCACVPVWCVMVTSEVTIHFISTNAIQ